MFREGIRNCCKRNSRICFAVNVNFGQDVSENNSLHSILWFQPMFRSVISDWLQSSLSGLTYVFRVFEFSRPISNRKELKDLSMC